MLKKIIAVIVVFFVMVTGLLFVRSYFDIKEEQVALEFLYDWPTDRGKLKKVMSDTLLVRPERLQCVASLLSRYQRMVRIGCSLKDDPVQNNNKPDGFIFNVDLTQKSILGLDANSQNILLKH